MVIGGVEYFVFTLWMLLNGISICHWLCHCTVEWETAIKSNQHISKQELLLLWWRLTPMPSQIDFRLKEEITCLTWIQTPDLVVMAPSTNRWRRSALYLLNHSDMSQNNTLRDSAYVVVYELSFARINFYPPDGNNNVTSKWTSCHMYSVFVGYLVWIYIYVYRTTDHVLLDSPSEHFLSEYIQLMARFTFCQSHMECSVSCNIITDLI